MALDQQTKNALNKAHQDFDLDSAYHCAHYAVQALITHIRFGQRAFGAADGEHAAINAVTVPPKADCANYAAFENLRRACRQITPETRAGLSDAHMIHAALSDYLFMASQIAVRREAGASLPFNDKVDTKIMADFSARLIFLAHKEMKQKSKDMDVYDVADQLLTQSRLNEMDIFVRFAGSGQDRDAFMIKAMKSYHSLVSCVLPNCEKLHGIEEEVSVMRASLTNVALFLPPPSPSPAANLGARPEQKLLPPPAPKQADILAFRPRNRPL